MLDKDNLWDETLTMGEVVHYSQLKSSLSSILEIGEQIDRIKPFHPFGILVIEARPLKNTLVPIVNKALSSATTSLQQFARNKVRSLLN